MEKVYALFTGEDGIGETGFEYLLKAIKNVVHTNLQYYVDGEHEEGTPEFCETLIECSELVDSLLYHNYFNESDNLLDSKKDLPKWGKVYKKWEKAYKKNLKVRKKDTKKLFKLLNSIQELI